MSLIQVQPTSFIVSAMQGMNASALQIAVSAYGGTINPAITSDQPWCTPTPASLQSTGNVRIVTLNFATTALAVGTYVASVILNDASDNPVASGFGDASYNGVYTVQGSLNGKPYYTNNNLLSLYYVIEGNTWVISDEPGQKGVGNSGYDLQSGKGPSGNYVVDQADAPGGTIVGQEAVVIPVKLFVTAIPVPPHVNRQEGKRYINNRLQPVGTGSIFGRGRI